MNNSVMLNRINQVNFKAKSDSNSMNNKVKLSCKKIINRFDEVTGRGYFSVVSEPFFHKDNNISYKINFQVESCEKGDLPPSIKNPLEYRRMIISVKKQHGHGLECSEVLALGQRAKILEQIKELDDSQIVKYIEKAMENIK